MNKEERVMEVDLVQLLKALWSKAKYIVLITAICGLLGFVGSKFLLDPVYEANAKLIVNTQSGEAGSNDRNNLAKNLVDTYAIVIRDPEVLAQVISELNLAESPEKLAGCISISAVNNTQIMKVSVRHGNKDVAYAVAQKIQQIAPAAIKDIVKVGSVGPVGQTSNPAMVGPRNARNAAVMALIGFVMSCGLVVIMFLTDNTYKSDVDIQDDLDVPVLGVIPKVECCGKYSRYGYYKYGYGYGYGKRAAKEESAKEA